MEWNYDGILRQPWYYWLHSISLMALYLAWCTEAVSWSLSFQGHKWPPWWANFGWQTNIGAGCSWKHLAHVSRQSYMNAVCQLWIKKSFIYLAYKDLDFKIWLACALGAHSFTCQSWKVLPLKTSSASCHNALPWTVNATQNGTKLSIHLTWITCSNVHHFQDWVTYPKRHAATSMPTCIMYNQQIAEMQHWT